MDYAECTFPQMSLITNNRLTDKTDLIPGNWSFQRDCAYHFDATKFGIWLRDKICLPQGVKHKASNTGWAPVMMVICYSSGDRQTVMCEDG